MSAPGKPPPLYGRRSECAVLDELLGQVRGGHGAALVLRGGAGMGKSALLEYLATAARGCRLVRAAGVRSEMKLPFAGLHQLCAPMLDRLAPLPGPQRDALCTAFGLADGPPPDRFLTGLATLSLMSEVAREQPLVCLIDDEQWLDRASAQVLGFVARRLAADPVGLVFAARSPGAELTALQELTVAGLPDGDARALLESALAGPLDARVRDLIVAETGGNPLALLELARGMPPAQLAGGFGLPCTAPPPSRIDDSLRRQLETLPAATRRLLLIAAADPSGDPVLVRRAAGRLGIARAAADPAVEAGLLEMAARVWFRHPSMRSAVYRAASPQDRRTAHHELAEVTDPRTDPDRRAWHRARAADGPDEEVAAELERWAGRAQGRGGLAAAAAFLERSVLLSTDPVRRTERGLAAAQVSLQAGAPAKAKELLAAVEAGPLDELQAGRAYLLRGTLAFAAGHRSDAPSLLLKAARRLELLDRELARQTYLSAWMAALFAGGLADAGDLLEVSRAAQELPAPAEPPHLVDLILDGLAMVVTDGPAAAGPTLRQVVRAFADPDGSAEQGLRWGWFAQAAATALWDIDAWRVMLVRQVRLARDAGALEQLPFMLGALGTAVAWSGDFTSAASLICEAAEVCAATGSQAALCATILLASLRGDQAEAAPLIEATISSATAAGQGIAVAYAHWVAAVLANGLGRYDEALAAARQAAGDTFTLHVSMWALPELIEAAVRSGNPQAAGDALARLTEATRAGGTDCGLGIQARSRALLSEGDGAESLYRESVDRLGRTQLRPELARAHLLYGEWLRRENRRADARVQLRTAHELLTALGMQAFAERARRELRATGEKVRKRTVETVSLLTAQEAAIARLACNGWTNPEIGAKFFLSARTVEWHLRKVFMKLGISSRRDLRRVLADLPDLPDVAPEDDRGPTTAHRDGAR
jgi:DNA-binding CsgD family transcriptional regulator